MSSVPMGTTFPQSARFRPRELIRVRPSSSDNPDRISNMLGIVDSYGGVDESMHEHRYHVWLFAENAHWLLRESEIQSEGRILEYDELPYALRHRPLYSPGELVRVVDSAEMRDDGIARKLGRVMGGYTGSTGEDIYSVMILELGIVYDIEERFLRVAGDSLSARERMLVSKDALG